MFSLSADDPCLQKIGLDFKFIKCVVEDSKRYGLNKDLPVGYRHTQDVDVSAIATLLYCDCVSDLRNNPAIKDFFFHIRVKR